MARNIGIRMKRMWNNRCQRKWHFKVGGAVKKGNVRYDETFIKFSKWGLFVNVVKAVIK